MNDLPPVLCVSVIDQVVTMMRPNELLKRNIDAMLKARGQKQKDLGQYCRKTMDQRAEVWISKIMTEPKREFPLKYWPRIADFFGIATYQLLHPGISALTERRGGRDRRTGMDRRISHAQEGLRPPRTQDLETVTPGERGHLWRLRRLSAEDRKLVELSIDRLLLVPSAAHIAAATTAQTDAAHAPTETVPRIRKQRKA